MQADPDINSTVDILCKDVVLETGQAFGVDLLMAPTFAILEQVGAIGLRLEDDSVTVRV